MKKFDASLKPWLAAMASFKARYPKTPVAVTEPIADYMLETAGAEIATPFSLQSAIMNGTDPSPQDVTLFKSLGIAVEDVAVAARVYAAAQAASIGQTLDW